MNNATTQSHIVWLDVIRTVAMLMVIGVHCIDPFYISPTLGSLPEYKHWAAVYGSLLRPSVPLFVMMTGLLLLPIREQSLGVFYKKRIYRVLFPFLIWSVLYNIFPWVTGLLGLPKEIIGEFFCYVQGNESQSLSDALKAVHLVVQRVFGRDNKHTVTAVQPFQLTQQVQTAPARQHDIQQNAVVIVVIDFIQCRKIVGSGLYNKLFFQERSADGFPQILLIFYNQDFHTGKDGL